MAGRGPGPYAGRHVPRLGDRCIPHSANIEKFLHGMGLQEPHHADHLQRHRARPSGEVRRSRDSPALRIGRCPGGALRRHHGPLSAARPADGSDGTRRPEPSGRKAAAGATIHHEKHLERGREEIPAAGVGDRVVITEPLELDSGAAVIPACDVAVVPRPQSPGFPIKILNYLAAKRAVALFAQLFGRIGTWRACVAGGARRRRRWARESCICCVTRHYAIAWDATDLSTFASIEIAG